jgi:hypothetical protein
MFARMHLRFGWSGPLAEEFDGDAPFQKSGEEGR